jgi:hypothetical protein
MAISLHRAPLYSTFLHRHQSAPAHRCDQENNVAGQMRWCRVGERSGERAGEVAGRRRARAKRASAARAAGPPARRDMTAALAATDRSGIALRFYLGIKPHTARKRAGRAVRLDWCLTGTDVRRGTFLAAPHTVSRRRRSLRRRGGSPPGRAFSRRALGTRHGARQRRAEQRAGTRRAGGARPAGRHGHRVGHRRQGRGRQAGPGRAARRGAPAHRGRARGRQDHARQGPRAVDRRFRAAHPVHPRPAAERRHRGQRLQPGAARVRVQAGADLRQHRRRRRDQPGLAEDPVGAAGVHGGAAGHRRRDHLPARPAVYGDRDPEPGRDGGHLPAA